MKRKIAIILCATLSLATLLSGCGKDKTNNKDVVLGDIKEEDVDEDGSIILGGVGIFDDEDTDEFDENLYSNTESTKPENGKEESKNTESKKPENNKEESKSTESTKLSNSELQKPENDSESSEQEPQSAYETFDSVALDKSNSAELYNWFSLNISSKVKVVDNIAIENNPKVGSYLYYVSEEDEQIIRDYYDYINNRISTDEDLAGFFVENIAKGEVTETFYVQSVEESIYFPSVENNSEH